LHIEGLRDGRGFIEAAGRVARKKPVLALKAGKSEHAAEAVQSHTGSLVGSDEVWEAALKQSGVIRVRSSEELGDAATAFSLLPLMKGKKIAVVTSTGGLGVMSVDACDQFDLGLAKLSPETIARIKALAPPWHNIGNPVDVWPGYIITKNPLTKVWTETLDAVLSDKEVAAVLFIWPVPVRHTIERLHHTLVNLVEAYPDKPLVCCLIGAHAVEASAVLQATGKIAVFYTPDRAVRVLSYLAQYSAFRKNF